MSDRTRNAVEEYIGRYDVHRCFETPFINVLNELLIPYDLKVCFMAEYFLSDVTILKTLDCGYELRIFRIALDRANCSPEHSMMIGDRLDNNIAPAHMIGMITVWVR